MSRIFEVSTKKWGKVAVSAASPEEAKSRAWLFLRCQTIESGLHCHSSKKSFMNHCVKSVKEASLESA